MNESYLYVGAAVICAGTFVLAFVICAASLVANQDGDGSQSQGGAAGERSDRTLD